MVTSRLTGGDLQWRHFHFSITESEQDQAVDDNSPPDGVSCCDQIHFKIHTFLWKWTFPATVLICEAPDFHYYITDVEISPSFNGYSWLYKLQESSMKLTRDLAYFWKLLKSLEPKGISPWNDLKEPRDISQWKSWKSDFAICLVPEHPGYCDIFNLFLHREYWYRSDGRYENLI